MEQDSYPAFYGEPSFAVPSASHMFQNATNFTIPGSRFMNVQGDMNIQPMFSHPSVRDVVLSLLEQERQGGRVVSGVPRNTLSPPAVYSEINNYCHQLLRQGRGFPMYVPSPQQNLPAAYRRTGIAIGDVGRVTPEGGFDFFFNIYRSASDPINANVPEDFVPLSPYNPIDLTHYTFDSGEYVSTPSVYDIDGGFSEPTPGGEFIFKCRGPDGAVLALPHGAYLEKLENLERMRQYAAKHAESWYRYVNEPGGRGRGLVNGSLCLITGCEKSKSWGMASFQNVSVNKEFPLSFRPTADEDNGYRYRWNGTRCRHKQADPPLVEGTPMNQTTFIHAFALSLGEGIWGRLFGGVHVSQLGDSSSLSGKSPGGFVPHGPQSSSFPWFLGFFGGGSTTGANDDASRSSVQGNTTISDVVPIPAIFHPAQLIHGILLHEVPQATVVITHDDDWREIFTEDATPITYSQLLQAIRDGFEIMEDGGTVFLRNKADSVSPNDLALPAEEPFDSVVAIEKMPPTPKLATPVPVYPDADEQLTPPPSAVSLTSSASAFSDGSGGFAGSPVDARVGAFENPHPHPQEEYGVGIAYQPVVSTYPLPIDLGSASAYAYPHASLEMQLLRAHPHAFNVGYPLQLEQQVFPQAQGVHAVPAYPYPPLPVLAPRHSGSHSYSYSFAHSHSAERHPNSSPPVTYPGQYAPSYEVPECSHCGRTSTPLWRRDPSTQQVLCNACGLYLQQRREPRPQIVIDADEDDDQSESDGDPEGPECSHCHTHQTSAWHRNKEGEQLCNACGVYQRLRGQSRPLELRRKK